MAKSKLPRFNLRSLRGEWVLVHHRSEALDDLDTSVLGLAAPQAFEVRAAILCAQEPSESEFQELVQIATQTPNHGDPGIPARIVVPFDAYVPRLRDALAGVAIQVNDLAAEDARMPTLLEAKDDLTELLADESEELSDPEKASLRAIEAILDAATAEFRAALDALDEEDEEDTGNESR